MNLLVQLGLVAAGGAAGAIARYAVYAGMMSAGRSGFPYATLLVNVLGSFVAGALAVIFTAGFAAHAGWRLFSVVGFLGAFTTYSAFSVDTLLLIEAGHWRSAGVNVVLNVGLCLGLCAIGMYATRTALH